MTVWKLQLTSKHCCFEKFPAGVGRGEHKKKLQEMLTLLTGHSIWNSVCWNSGIQWERTTKNEKFKMDYVLTNLKRQDVPMTWTLFYISITYLMFAFISHLLTPFVGEVSGQILHNLWIIIAKTLSQDREGSRFHRLRKF